MKTHLHIYFFRGGGGQQNKTLARHRCGRTGRAPLGNETEAGNGDLFLSQSLGWTVVWLVCSFFFYVNLSFSTVNILKRPAVVKSCRNWARRLSCHHLLSLSCECGVFYDVKTLNYYQ